MDAVAFKQGHLSNHSQDRTTPLRSSVTSGVNEDLLPRIRALFLSRNDQYPPRTPCPSPDFLLPPRELDRASAENLGNAAGNLDFKSIAKLAYTDSRAEGDVINGFDGQAGLESDLMADVLEHHSGQSGTAPHRSLSLSGERADSPGSDASSRRSSTQSQRPRKPRYILRTIAPTTSQQTLKEARPSFEHVPGSYVSEHDYANRIDSKTFNPEPPGLKSRMPERQLKRPMHVRTPSVTTTTSQDSAHNAHHPLLKSHIDHSTLGAAAEPVLTPNLEHENRDLGGPRPVAEAGVPDEASEHISKLLSQLPPFGKDGSNHTEPMPDPGHSARIPEALILRTHLPPKSKDNSIEKNNEHSDTSPKSSSGGSSNTVRHVLKNGPGDEGSHLTEKTSIANPDGISTLSQTLSSLGKTISMMSLAPLRTSSRRSTRSQASQAGKDDGHALPNLTARPQYHQDYVEERGRANSSGESLGSGHAASRRREWTDNLDSASPAVQKVQTTESFENVITDLEALLREALQIAQQAADRDEKSNTLSAPTNAPAKLDDNRDSDHTRSNRTRGSPEDDAFLQDAPKSEDHVMISEPEEEDLYHGQFRKVRNATPYPARSAASSRHPSITPAVSPEKREPDQPMKSGNFLSIPVASSRKDSTGSNLRQERRASSDLSSSNPLPRAMQEPDTTNPSHKANETSKTDPVLRSTQQYPGPRRPESTRVPTKEQLNYVPREHKLSPGSSPREAVHGYANTRQRPPIQPRTSSVRLRLHNAAEREAYELENLHNRATEVDPYSNVYGDGYIADFNDHTPRGNSSTNFGPSPGPLPRHDTIAPLRDVDDKELYSDRPQDQAYEKDDVSVKSRHHFGIREPHAFSLRGSHRPSPIARDWNIGRKRFVATITCITTALMGLLIGIYAGEVPAIQYAVVDQHHYVIQGNVLFFIGLAITTILFWPLPLLHGRKPYTLTALVLVLPLQFPQAVVVQTYRDPHASYRVGLLLSRCLEGLAMGFANINFQTTLLDLFGSSLQSTNPHQEVVDENDVRRHGGGMGVWLGVWTWCFIGSLGLGFLIGAAIISRLDVAWGFWISIILTAAVLLLNVITPEVRRSPYRRSTAEVRTPTEISRRMARGEIKMHLYSTGPKNWWEEVLAGQVLCARMLRQPGFAVLSLYIGWIYGQIVMVIVVSN